MSKERVEQINDRIDWLQLEIVHENYWPGRIVDGFRKELSRLLNELELLEENDTSKQG
jgi:hypothetical protein